MIKKNFFANCLILLSFGWACGNEHKNEQKKYQKVTSDKEPSISINDQTLSDDVQKEIQNRKRQECSARGKDFEWDGSSCNEVPNRKLTGMLSAEPGLIWRANFETCNRISTLYGDRYVNCAGIDVTIPMPTIEDARSLNTVAILFHCESLVPLNATLNIADSFKSNGWGPGKNSFYFSTIVDEGAKPLISISLAPTDSFEAVKDGCRIELLENTAKIFSGL